MTQPAAATPSRHQDGAGAVRDRSSRRGQRSPRSWPWTAGIVGSGVLVGVLWWLLAPGGLNLISGNASLASGTNTEVWLPRDLVLAGLSLVAGCLVAVLLAGRKDGGSGRMLVLSVAASGAAALLAWQTGLLAGLWLGGPQDTSDNASVAFSLRSYPVLLLWPAAAAGGYFAISLLELLHRPRDRGADTGHGV
ncbi:hypothetical protein [Arthrobacter pascens]|uniref:hypothetical protein n=1 Tax=Arthrobacter pascens TaxID=1677 RepID=UPI00196A811F|nr:hypothetical protein [Arthrobacter pascens]MBN3497435.1 hypothetical protein [Arthrobacter pascens]MDR6559093.1 hypothetical protein [Arthrobacter pascens]